MSKYNPQDSYLEEFDPNLVINPEEYAPFIGNDRVEELKKLAQPVNGKTWTNINSTLIGGGVAEMLRSLVPLARGLGIKASWYAIRGNHFFFQTTKKYHNMLQGLDLPISIEEIFGAYLSTLEENAKNMSIASDLIVVHDPQPAGLITHGVLYGNVLWRCHIDTSKPHKTIWRFLLPYLNQYAGAIFTMPEFVGPGLQTPLYEVSPCIDPKAEKNKQYDEKEALDILAPLFKKHKIDSSRPIIAAISRYDIHKNQESILIAFNKLLQDKKFKKRPYLIFLGNTATDDPEGDTVLEGLKNKSGDHEDVKFWVNVENNDKVVGALMSIAKTFVHVSTKEGFGLVVSEALWQGTPVIGSRVGGIVKQVEDQKNGFLVDPKDVGTIADKMAWFLDHPDEAKEFGKNGQEHVRQNFLLPALMKRYLVLLQYYSKVSQTTPEFRLNDMTYSEVMNSVRNLGLDSSIQAQIKSGSKKTGPGPEFKIA